MLGAVPSIKADLIHLQLGDITDTPHIKSQFRTPTQWSSRWAVQTLPSSPVSCQAPSRYGFTPGNLEMKKRRISSSKFRVQDWNGFFFYPISFSSYHIRLSNTILCKAVSGTRMCTWWINQQILRKGGKKTAGIVSCYIQVWLSARCGRLHFSPSGLVFCTTECKEIKEEKNRQKVISALALKNKRSKRDGHEFIYWDLKQKIAKDQPVIL